LIIEIIAQVQGEVIYNKP